MVFACRIAPADFEKGSDVNLPLTKESFYHLHGMHGQAAPAGATCWCWHLRTRRVGQAFAELIL
jgi:hypothetical protein